jgi:hypothetical protein
MKYLLTLGFLVIAFLLNPLWGCGGIGEPDFEYGRQDMVDYAAGTWTGTLTLPSGEETDFELIISDDSTDTQSQGLKGQKLREIEQSSCRREFSQRLGDFFVRSAYACISTSILPVQAIFTTSDGQYQQRELPAKIVVRSRLLSGATIQVALPDGGSLQADCDDHHQCDDGFFYTMDQDSREQGELISMHKI